MLVEVVTKVEVVLIVEVVTVVESVSHIVGEPHGQQCHITSEDTCWLLGQHSNCVLMMYLCHLYLKIRHKYGFLYVKSNLCLWLQLKISYLFLQLYSEN